MEGKVLIIEDEKSIVDILRFNLEKQGYTTCEAYDGQTGLEMALSEKPDLILLDLMLPKMDGFEVCRRLREKNNEVKVIILTAREEENDKEKMEQMLKALLQDEKEIREKMEELEKTKSKSRSIEKNW